MGFRPLYGRKYGFGLVLDTFLVLFVSFVAFIGLTNKPLHLLVLLALTLLGLILPLVILTRFWLPFIVIRRLVGRRRYLRGLDDQSLAWLGKSAAGIELDGVDNAGLIIDSDGWRLYDIAFDSHRRTKHGRYKSRESFYTVFEIGLQRPVPHLVFDSKAAKRHQFSRLYLKAQQLQLGPLFDQQFASYAPQHYKIDALSFITPEVMEAMLAMPDRDFEFLGDRLICYAPLIETDELDRFCAFSLELHRQANDNLTSYRDDRLDRARGKQEVADFGQQLLKNPYQHLAWLILFGLLLLGLIVGAIVQADIDWILNQATVSVAVVFGGLVVELVQTKRKNSRLEATFLAGQVVDNGPSAVKL